MVLEALPTKSFNRPAGCSEQSYRSFSGVATPNAVPSACYDSHVMITVEEPPSDAEHANGSTKILPTISHWDTMIAEWTGSSNKATKRKAPPAAPQKRSIQRKAVARIVPKQARPIPANPPNPFIASPVVAGASGPVRMTHLSMPKPGRH
ncbi:hypothetical protein J8273_2093 [Carpediemonas membranifera]|uniref:Uncharacterized protein n=1 Tax=Carpediemonas membranifera TaxID=201153 RepID=A0A8J6BAT1_9EUKA|nr:hypothetical protein J8273_2093 [Carpediemonas membranifera]|eukprot:KAG9396362.1 hypothetical protein J8273_2093 [Carpediemonas membranifera]